MKLENFDDEEEVLLSSSKKKRLVLDSDEEENVDMNEEENEEGVWDAEEQEEDSKEVAERREKEKKEKIARRKELKEIAKRNLQLQQQTQLLASVDIPKKIPKKTDSFAFAQKLVERLTNVNAGRFVPDGQENVKSSSVCLTADVECGVNVEPEDSDELIVVAEVPDMKIEPPKPKIDFSKMDELDLIMNEGHLEKVGDLVVDRTKVLVNQLPAFKGIDLWDPVVQIEFVSQKKTESNEEFKIEDDDIINEEDDVVEEKESEDDLVFEDEEEQESNNNEEKSNESDFDLAFSDESSENQQQKIGQIISSVVKKSQNDYLSQNTQLSQQHVLDILKTPLKTPLKRKEEISDEKMKNPVMRKLSYEKVEEKKNEEEMNVEIIKEKKKDDFESQLSIHKNIEIIEEKNNDLSQSLSMPNESIHSSQSSPVAKDVNKDVSNSKFEEITNNNNNNFETQAMSQMMEKTPVLSYVEKSSQLGKLFLLFLLL